MCFEGRSLLDSGIGIRAAMTNELLNHGRVNIGSAVAPLLLRSPTGYSNASWQAGPPWPPGAVGPSDSVWSRGGQAACGPRMILALAGSPHCDLDNGRFHALIFADYLQLDRIQTAEA